MKQYAGIGLFVVGIVLGMVVSQLRQYTTPKPLIYSESSQSLYDSAQTLQDSGSYLRAIGVYAQLLTQDSAYIPALTAQAQCYQALGLFVPALADLDVALSRDPANWNVLMLRANMHYIVGQNGQALADAKRALSVAPSDAGILSQISTTFFQIGDMKAAEATLDQAIHVNPLSYTLYWLRANVLTNQNKIDDARRNYQTAARLATGKNRLEMLQNLADWSLSEGDTTLALHVYRVELREARQYYRVHASDQTLHSYIDHASVRLQTLTQA